MIKAYENLGTAFYLLIKGGKDTTFKTSIDIIIKIQFQYLF